MNRYKNILKDFYGYIQYIAFSFCLLQSASADIKISSENNIENDQYYGGDGSFLCLLVPEYEEYQAASVEGRLIKISTRVGDYVSSGTIVAEQKNNELESMHAIVDAKVAISLSIKKRLSYQLNRAIKDKEIIQSLKADISKRQLETAEDAVNELQYTIEGAEGEIDQYIAERSAIEEKIDTLTIRTNTAGNIAAFYPKLGEYLSVGSPILRLVSERIFVRVAIPASININVGDKFQVTQIGNSGNVVKKDAIVRNISPTPDMAAMLLVETHSLDGEPNYRPGELCRLKIK